MPKPQALCPCISALACLSLHVCPCICALACLSLHVCLFMYCCMCMRDIGLVFGCCCCKCVCVCVGLHVHKCTLKKCVCCCISVYCYIEETGVPKDCSFIEDCACVVVCL